MANVFGTVDGFEAPDRLWGWATDDLRNTSRKLEIRVTYEGRVLATVTASSPRSDLVAIGDGAIAYNTVCSRHISLSDFSEGRIAIQAYDAGSLIGPVPMGPLLHRQIAAFEIEQAASLLARAVARSPAPDISDLLSIAVTGAPPLIRNGLTAMGTAIQADPRTPSDPILELTSLHFPVGIMSNDGTACLGRDGYVFLTGGSNNLLHLYQRDPLGPVVQQQTAQWVDLFRTRSRNAKIAGRRYIQIIVPEKITLHPDLLPSAPRVPTPLLAGVERSVRDDADLNATYVSGRRCLAPMSPACTFKAADSHLRPQGVFSIFKRCMEVLGLDIGFSPTFSKALVAFPDMSTRFFGIPFYDIIHDCSPPPFAAHRMLLRHVDPPGGGHIGQHQVWHNPDAPIAATVLAFGNSFFGGGTDQGCLSWWFSNWFRNFHHVWSPAFDGALIAEVAPDVVVGQTIERFMEAIPSS